ncbi:MAG TPA: tetratricopeptide repeat protein [Candidatus Limnocylindrales bacterium]|nr:tetratricopeptide repeat protein [Candidatus Limnocylindrales bacterium]
MKAWWASLKQAVVTVFLNRAYLRRTLVIVATVALSLLARELLLDTAVGAVADWIRALPLWAQILIVLVLAVSGVAALRLSRQRPKPDAVQTFLGGLPPPPSPLVGRDGDLAAVVDALKKTGKVAVVGRRGVGTSAVAVHAAARVAEGFAETPVYMDLRGLVNRPPHTPESALHHLMSRIGLAEPRSLAKRDLDDAARRLQAWYAEHRTVLMLNNVDDPRQVARLLPMTGGCVVVLAGSLDLEALPRVRTHKLDELSESAAIELLSAVGGAARVAQDPGAARDLVTECGRQPLAVRLLGQLLRDRHWPLRQFVDEMRRSARASRHFPPGEQPDSLGRVWDAADVTYRDLTFEQRRVFRLLALMPTIEIGRNAASAVAGLPPERTTRALDELARRGLIESARPGYYRVRQLLAGSAGYHLINEDSQRQRQRARHRLARYYALLAERYAEPLLFAHKKSDDPPSVSLLETEGYRWFRREHATLMRLITSPAPDDELTRVKPWLWRLAMGLCTWYAVEERLDAWQTVCHAILAMPAPMGWRTRLGGTTRMWATEVAYWAHNELGVVYRRRGRTDNAFQELEIALGIASQWRLRSRAQVETNLGLVLVDKGQLDQAIRHLEQGLKLRGRSDVRGRAISGLGLGIACLHAEMHDTARRHLSHAANEFERLGDRAGQAAALNALGLVLAGQGDRTGIREHWDLARRHYADAGDEVGEASVLLNIGADLLRDRPDQAAAGRRILNESIQLRKGQPETIYTALVHQRLGDAASLDHDDAAAARHRAEAQRILDALQ